MSTMPTKPSSEPSPRLGLPEEAQRSDQRQIEVEEVSRRFSTITPVQNIRAQGQFLQKVTQRPWSGWVIAGLWVLAGLPLAAMLGAGVFSAVTHGTAAERMGTVAGMVFFPGVPLLALAAFTRKWYAERR